MIKLREVKFGYPGDRLVFDGLDFEYGRKRRIGIVGPNGAGKTTLFYLIMGLLKPQSGEIEIFGKVRKTEKDFVEVRERIGLLFQNPDYQLFCPTVAEDIAFGPLNLGKKREEVIVIVKEIAQLLGLEKYLDRASYKLSWGEKRIISLATIVAMNPEVFLLDEPTAGLDENSTERVVDYLKDNAHSYIIASHDVELLKVLTDQIYLLNNGKIIY